MQVLEPGEDLTLAAKAAEHHVSVHAALDYLDRDLFLKLVVVPYGAIHNAHSPSANDRGDQIRTDSTAYRRFALRSGKVLCMTPYGCVDLLVGLLAIHTQKCLDLEPQIIVTITGLGEKCPLF